MAGKRLTYPITHNLDSFNTAFTDGGETQDVGKEDRKHRVLRFLVESSIAMPRTVLYRNLRFRGADFSDSSLKNYLAELRDEGLVERIDAEAFADTQVRVSDDDPGYWIATNKGAEQVGEIKSAQRDDIDTSHL